MAAQSLICSYPAQSRQYLLEILQSHPALIDLLLKCAALPRPPWNPDWLVDAVGKHVCLV